MPANPILTHPDDPSNNPQPPCNESLTRRKLLSLFRAVGIGWLTGLDMSAPNTGEVETERPRQNNQREEGKSPHHTETSPQLLPSSLRLTLTQLETAETAITQLKQFINHARAQNAADVDAYELIKREQSVIEAVEALYSATHNGDWGNALGIICDRDPYALYLEYYIQDGALDRAELQREITAIAKTRPTEAAHLQAILDQQSGDGWGSNA